VNPPLEKSARLGAGAVVLLTTSIFVLDLLTPLGWADWLLYFIPLVLTLRSPRDRDSYDFAAVVTLLTALGGYFSPRDIHPAVALMNRVLGLMVMWGVTWMIVRQKQARSQLVVGMMIAKAIIYPVTIHSTCSTVVPKVAMIFGKATLTMLVSRMAIKLPRMTTARMDHFGFEF